jgi:hypothetical protein
MSAGGERVCERDYRSLGAWSGILDRTQLKHMDKRQNGRMEWFHLGTEDYKKPHKKDSEEGLRI